MGKVYAVANRKGGCSKTTTVGALASGLTRCGYKTLVVDTDPQGNISDWAMIDTNGENTLREVILRECTTKEAIKHTPHYDIIPADDDLTSAESELDRTPGKEFRLKEALDEVRDEYDFIIIDTPPQLGYLTLIAFAAADGGIIITSDASSFATKGMSKLVETLDNVKRYLNNDIRVIGILFTRINPQTIVFKTMQEITRQFGEIFDAPIYETRIRQSTAVMNAQLSGVDIFDVARINPATTDYKEFVAEFLVREGFDRPDTDEVFK